MKTNIKNPFRFQFVATAAVLLALAGAVHAGTIIGPQIVTNNASADITNAYTYTHAINIGEGNPAPSVTINGVTFTGGTTSGNGWSTSGFGGTVGLNQQNFNTWFPPSSGSVAAMISDFRYNSANVAQSLTLTGLTPGQMYEARVYTRFWEVGDRTNNIAFDEDGIGPLGSSVVFNADLTPTNAYYIGYTYTADSSGNLVVTFARPNGDPGMFHLSGFSNQVIPEPSTWALVGLGLMGTWLLRRRRR
jgi:hypothetical protein